MNNRNIPEYEISWELMVKYLSGECTSREEKLIEEWISADKLNKKHYIFFKKIWETSGQINSNINALAAWERFQARIKYHPNENANILSQERKKEKRNLHLFYKFIAAASILALIIGLHFYNNYFKSSEKAVKNNENISESLYKEIFTKKGEKATVILTDGTKIQLNSSSKIKYPVNFTENERKISLFGEAYFQVTPEQSRPFIVETKNAEIKVLGTAFNVTAWSNDRKTDVVVNSGRVAVSSTKNSLDSSVILVKGQKTTILEEGTPLNPRFTNLSASLAWMQGKLVFEKATFLEVCKQLERHYNYIFRIRDSLLYSRHLTAVIDNQSLKSTLKYICLSMMIKYEKRGNIITFYDPKGRKNN